MLAFAAIRPAAGCLSSNRVASDGLDALLPTEGVSKFCRLRLLRSRRPARGPPQIRGHLSLSHGLRQGGLDQ